MVGRLDAVAEDSADAATSPIDATQRAASRDDG